MRKLWLWLRLRSGAVMPPDELTAADDAGLLDQPLPPDIDQRVRRKVIDAIRRQKLGAEPEEHDQK